MMNRIKAFALVSISATLLACGSNVFFTSRATLAGFSDEKWIEYDASSVPLKLSEEAYAVFSVPMQHESSPCMPNKNISFELFSTEDIVLNLSSFEAEQGDMIAKYVGGKTYFGSHKRAFKQLKQGNSQYVNLSSSSSNEDVLALLSKNTGIKTRDRLNRYVIEAAFDQDFGCPGDYYKLVFDYYISGEERSAEVFFSPAQFKYISK